MSWRRFLPALALLALACASEDRLAPTVAPEPPDPDAPLERAVLERWLTSRGAAIDNLIVAWDVDAEMVDWAEAQVRPGRAEDRLRALAAALLGDAAVDREIKESAPADSTSSNASGGQAAVALRYTAERTATAREAFDTGRANCLAFTNLFLGLARALGHDAYFLAIETVETIRREGDLVIVSDHVGVGWGAGSSRLVFDFSATPSSERRLRRLTDLRALAMFHSNRGAEAVRGGEPIAAVTWLERAVEIDPGFAPAWVNLGVARRRAGDVEGAEDAYRKALLIDPRAASAGRNLIGLLRSDDRLGEAEAVRQALAEAPGRDPFTHLLLADLARSAGRLGEAERFYRRAERLGDAEVRSEALSGRGLLALRGNDRRAAGRLLRDAAALEVSIGVRQRQLKALLDARKP
ncbi:MAG: tetratricopeptide repeat protein [Acidobacteriota bacterium]